MSDPASALHTLRRPRMLIRAARIGLLDYRRERDLARLLRTARTPAPKAALSALLEQEEQLEETRRLGDATYSISRHIELLIAMMAEARLLPGTSARLNG